jgi:hypothetical protein
MTDFDYPTDNALTIIENYLLATGDNQPQYTLQTGLTEKFVEVS